MGHNSKTTRFAPYIENHHKTFLNNINSEVNTSYHDSPYGQNLNVDEVFFGTGFLLSNHESLLEMFGKYQSGIDVTLFYNQIFDQFMNGDMTQEMEVNEYKVLYNIVSGEIIPKFKQGLLDINAPLAKAYVRGEELIYDSCDKVLEKFRAELRYRLLITITEQWKVSLKWNRDIAGYYAEFLKIYVESCLIVNEYNQGLRAKDALWPFTILEFQRSALNVLQSTTNIPASKGAGSRKEPSQMAKSVSSMVSWGAMGAQIGGPWGAAVGASIGLAVSFA